jgi:hypothetical protein
MAQEKPLRPSKAAIAALKADPTRAIAFDQKFGTGSAGAHLNGNAGLAGLLQQLLDQTRANNRRLGEMVEALGEMLAHMAAPKRVVRDRDGEIIGVEPVDDDEELEPDLADEAGHSSLLGLKN